MFKPINNHQQQIRPCQDTPACIKQRHAQISTKAMPTRIWRGSCQLQALTSIVCFAVAKTTFSAPKFCQKIESPKINKLRQLQSYFPPSCNQHPSSTPHQFCVEHMLLPLNTPLSTRPVWTSRRQGKPPNWPEPVRLPWVMIVMAPGVSHGKFRPLGTRLVV